MIEYWQDLTTTDFSSLDPSSSIALLPVAAIEQHGPHLPLSTDLEIIRGILASTRNHASSGNRVLVLPEQAVGDSLEHSGFAGTLSARPELLLESWSGIGRHAARSGLRKLVILNSHGGQTGLVDQVALRLRAEERMLVVRANYFAFGVPQGLFDPFEVENGLHGGEVETSMMLHLRPDLVRETVIQDFPGPRLPAGALLGPERPVGFAWMSQDLNAAGALGRAASADRERGAKYLDYLGSCLAKLLSETAAMPLSLLQDGPLDS